MRWLALLFLAGCAHVSPAPARATDDPAFTPPVVIRLPGLREDRPTPDVLLPGDVLNVRLVSQTTTDLSNLVIDGNGTIHLPLYGDVKVGGATIADAEMAVEGAVRAMDKFGRVMLTVSDPRGHKATVLGTVEKQGVVVVVPGMRLADLLAAAGGPKQFTTPEGEVVISSDLAGSRLVRGGVALPVDPAIALSGDPHHNVFVHPGDLLYVPPLRGQRVSVMGLVGTPKSMAFREGLRLSEAIAMAGGPTKDADKGDVRVIRGPLSNPRVYEASIKALYRGRTHDVQLEAGDVVFVTEHWFASVGDVLQRLSPIFGAAALAGIFYRP
jgi:polysaccharide export outer membrane protein